ncbi:hypothetical protein GMDG_00163 [Pseudogymnoascus destructans 20631-21]|uniref:Uncharacterized protein n=1 Tax=Pseudogymnoascus destructans (strain ATCC MYA-4855 / 20631-21) TaxID=658429 RepID=L8FWJ2_PSED2|nr:hypothetical protein GMDG_00163 [Pseudogymnoascus destructans 20631-21]
MPHASRTEHTSTTYTASILHPRINQLFHYVSHHAIKNPTTTSMYHLSQPLRIQVEGPLIAIQKLLPSVSWHTLHFRYQAAPSWRSWRSKQYTTGRYSLTSLGIWSCGMNTQVGCRG